MIGYHRMHLRASIANCSLRLLLAMLMVWQSAAWGSPPEQPRIDKDAAVVTQQLDNETPHWKAGSSQKESAASSSATKLVFQTSETPTLRLATEPRPRWFWSDILGTSQWTEDEEIPPKWQLVNWEQTHGYSEGGGHVEGMGHPDNYVPHPFPFNIGGGEIEVTDPADDPYVPIFGNAPPGSLFDPSRPNVFNIDVPDAWDFYNLISTDRPDFTDATYSVGKNRVVIETGYTFRNSSTNELKVNRQQLPEALLRLGLTDEFEIRMKWNGLVTSEIIDKTTGVSTANFGSDDLQLGFKYEVIQQDGWKPMLTMLGGAAIPSGTRGVSAKQVQPFFNTVLGWGIRRWLYLKVSTGTDFLKSNDATHVFAGSIEDGRLVVSSVDNTTEWHSSASLLYQLSPRVGGFFEWFAFYSNNSSDNRPAHYLDMGYFLYATTNVQFDIRIGERLSDRVDTLFTGAGMSVRY
ncbi:MAG: transporter [Planctomycetaceae bacterium]|nr:transporter [Planctomycetaceae bacterium]